MFRGCSEALHRFHAKDDDPRHQIFRRDIFVEKLFWIIVFCISALISFYMIYTLFHKWKYSPVIVTFNERSKPTWQIPFPAVTICPEIKAYREKINFTNIFYIIEKNETVPEEDLRNYAAMTQICEDDLFWDNKTKIPNGLETKDIRSRLIDMSLNVSDVFESCAFKNTYVECDNIFEPELTGDGACFTFNNLYLDDIYKDEALIGVDFMQNPKEKHVVRWSLDDGYSTKKLHTFPNRVLGSGVTSGLTVELKFRHKDFDYVCRGPTQGFKVQLHPPNELPNVKNNFFNVPLEQDVMVNVKPQVMETSEGLRSYKPEERQCYYSYESKLRFFKSYTKTNCEIECSANFTLNQCGCVHMSMPHDNGTRICGFLDTRCVWLSQYYMSLIETGSDFESLFDESEDENAYLADQNDDKELDRQFAAFKSKIKIGRSCNCLPSCISINYESEVTQTNYKKRTFPKTRNESIDPAEKETQTVLSIYFSNDEFFPSKRSELYGVIDFIANCGGLLGLFMGISVLSVVEIFYYLSLRPACNPKVKREESPSTQIH